MPQSVDFGTPRPCSAVRYRHHSPIKPVGYRSVHQRTAARCTHFGPQAATLPYGKMWPSGRQGVVYRRAAGAGQQRTQRLYTCCTALYVGQGTAITDSQPQSGGKTSHVPAVQRCTETRSVSGVPAQRRGTSVNNVNNGNKLLTFNALPGLNLSNLTGPPPTDQRPTDRTTDRPQPTGHSGIPNQG